MTAAAKGQNITACIHQPDFAPWLGFFERLARSDVFVVLDHVQYVRRGWHNRDRIEVGGREAWLSVPVISIGKYDQAIGATEINNAMDWRRKHLATLKGNYSQAAFFSQYIDALTSIYSVEHSNLADFNMALIMWAFSLMEINVELSFSSSLQLAGNKDDMLINCCEKLGATRYVTGTGARAYLQEPLFTKHGIEVVWQNWQEPVYDRGAGPKRHGLSFLDALFHTGPKIKDIIRPSWDQQHGGR